MSLGCLLSYGGASRHNWKVSHTTKEKLQLEQLLLQVKLRCKLKCCVLFRKHAYVDLASEMDVTKALMLNGEMVFEKPMKVEKAKIKSAEKVKISAEEKRGKACDCHDVLHSTLKMCGDV